MRLVGILITLLLLAGCSATPLPPVKVTYLPDGSRLEEKAPEQIAEEERSKAITACMDARKAKAEAERARHEADANTAICHNGMSDIMCMCIMMNRSQTKLTEAVLSFAEKVAGKREPTCAEEVGNGLFDYKIAEVHEKNKSFRHGADSVAGGLKAALLSWFGVTAVKQAGDDNSQYVNGDENSPSLSGRRVSDQSGTTLGEDSPVNLGGESGAAEPAPSIPGITPIETVDTAN